jgi:hypothetical protein
MMAAASWKVSGQYYETCNCDFMCPCILQQMEPEPTEGTCIFAMGYQIENGTFGSTSLDGLGFIVLGFTPEAMGKGNWSVGLVIDDRATAEQRDAITAIASGAAGGPMAGLSGLIGNFLGVESAPIQFARDGAKWSVTAPNLVDIAGQPAMGLNPEATEPIYLDNIGHPVANRIALARGLKMHVNALGLSWNHTNGNKSGAYAPFSWRSN